MEQYSKTDVDRFKKEHEFVMSNKFYTPDISEFYVGFEYRIQIDMWDMYGNRCWSNVVMDKLDRPTSGARVKYLDREDIESLGLVFKNINWGCEHNYVKDLGCTSPRAGHIITITLIHNTNSNKVKINIHGTGMETGVEGFDSDVFRGIIKNKSELLKVLKQVEIIK